jgi:uncharacterized protein (DUF58 family)
MRTLPTAGPSPHARFVDPRVLAKIDNLELVARMVVEGFLNGLHRSPTLGLSMDFAEHRAYMPGDDIRRIDWRVFGRTDRFFVKEFEADTNTNVTIVLDVSRSMSYASAGVTKLDYGRYLAACLAFFSHRQRDRVGLVTVDHDVVQFVPPAAAHLRLVLHAIDTVAPGRQGAEPGRLERPLMKVAEHARRRSVLVLISDLYEEPTSLLRALNILRHKGSDLLVFHLLDPAELTFPFTDASSFEDLESGERISVVPEILREQYRTMISQHLATLSRLTAESGIDYALFDTSKPLDDALFAYLANRQRLSRVR